MIQYVVTNESKGGTVRLLYADYSSRVRGLVFASNDRGWAECTGFVPMGTDEAFALWSTFGTLRVQVNDSSSGTVYDGRIEDIALTGDGVTITALGFSRALSDAPYTALWSKSGTADWRPFDEDDTAILANPATPGRFQFDTNNRLMIQPIKGAILGNTGTTKSGMVGFVLPSGSSRDIIGAQFDYRHIAPTASWRFFFQTRNEDFSGIANPWSKVGGAGVVSGSVFVTFAAARIVNFMMDFNAADAAFAGETGSAYLVIYNLRLVTNADYSINTTNTVGWAAGASVTITVGTTSRMYAGQRLAFDYGAGFGEAVIVESVTNATQFVAANITTAAAPGIPIQAHVVYADRIALDLVDEINALNPGHLDDSVTLISTPALDLFDESYEDQLPSDILSYLAAIGDRTGAQWEWGVKADKQLYFQLRGATARTWYVDVSTLDIQRMLDQLTNSVYAVYQDASGRAVRTAATSDTGSVARYGLTRRAALDVSTTSATQAGLQQATALADGKDPKPRSGVVITKIFDATGARWPLWHVQAQDTVVIRNLSPALGVVMDRIRVFRLSRASYDCDTDTLTVEPETPRASLDSLLAQLSAGVQRQISARAKASRKLV